MTESMYFNEIGSGYHHFPNGQSLDFNHDNSDIYTTQPEFRVQPQILQTDLLLPTQYQRQDSLFSSASVSPIAKPKQVFSPQQQQAAPQPYAPTAQVTHQGCMQRPVNMTRTDSQYSTSSGHQQCRASPHRKSISSLTNPDTTNMSRSNTQKSTGSIDYQQQQYTAGFQPNQPDQRLRYLSSIMGQVPSAFASSEPLYIPASAATMAAPSFGLADGLEKRGPEPLFGRTTTTTEYTHDFFDEPFRQEAISPTSNTEFSTTPGISVVSRTHGSHSPPTLAPKRRRRRSSHSIDDRSDPVIGQLTSSGKFKCIDPSCSDITFGRQADFRRHYDNVHAPRKEEFFCPIDGCSRSKRPAGKAKGRSFGGREDKMRDHVKTVHGSKGKRKRSSLSIANGGEIETMMEDKHKQLSAKDNAVHATTNWADDVLEGSGTWTQYPL